MSREEFGSNRVVVFRTVHAPRWLAYCPCCHGDLGHYFLHGNAVAGALSHARQVHA